MEPAKQEKVIVLKVLEIFISPHRYCNEKGMGEKIAQRSEGCSLVPQEHFAATWRLPAQLEEAAATALPLSTAAHFRNEKPVPQLRLARLRVKPGTSAGPGVLRNRVSGYLVKLPFPSQ